MAVSYTRLCVISRAAWSEGFEPSRFVALFLFCPPHSLRCLFSAAAFGSRFMCIFWMYFHIFLWFFLNKKTPLLRPF